MYSWRKWINLDVVAALLALLLVFLLLGKIQVGERAENFYIVRPTHWTATPTEINIELTSFYPATLTCDINTPYKAVTATFQPRSSINLVLKGNFPPNSYVTIPIKINCGVVKEDGKVVVYIFT